MKTGDKVCLSSNPSEVLTIADIAGSIVLADRNNGEQVRTTLEEIEPFESDPEPVVFEQQTP